ncbi:hypothetical protein RUM43_011671 [Polyplax serrata]|uniref:Protein SMG9 n=1 Tax=Polyplax serrata TaxID=468196 RepID=A0AAN8NYH0_POLSC
MGEYSRSQEFRKKSDYQSNREHRRGPSLLLSKSDKDHGRDQGSKKTLLSNIKEEKQHPTILIKTRDGERALSPCSKGNLSSQSQKRDGETTQPVYQLHSKLSTTEAVAAPEMAAPVKLLDLENGSLIDNCLEFLSDQNDFLVVGVTGYQGVGKSTLMSLLAEPRFLSKNVEKTEDLESAVHKTDGIDIYVTSNRTMFLDTQPILSPSCCVKLLQQQESQGKKFQHSDNYCVESSDVEIQSLQMITFLFSVCHIVLFVQDYWFDPDLIRFLQTAEMLKPSTPTTVDESMMEYFPHIMFVHNKAPDSDFQARKIKEIQEIYCKTFMHSRLQFQTGFGIADGEVNPALNVESCGEMINLFLLPEMNEEPDKYRGHSGFSNLILQLRRQILSTPRTPLTHPALTEKNWWVLVHLIK